MTMARWTGVLRNLRHGGWGKKDLLNTLQDMMQLEAKDSDGNDGFIRNPMGIAHKAHAYYDALFNPTRNTPQVIEEER